MVYLMEVHTAHNLQAIQQVNGNKLTSISPSHVGALISMHKLCFNCCALVQYIQENSSYCLDAKKKLEHTFIDDHAALGEQTISEHHHHAY